VIVVDVSVGTGVVAVIAEAAATVADVTAARAASVSVLRRAELAPAPAKTTWSI